MKNPQTFYRLEALQKSLLSVVDAVDDLPHDFTEEIYSMYGRIGRLMESGRDELEEEIQRRIRSGENLLILP